MFYNLFVRTKSCQINTTDYRKAKVEKQFLPAALPCAISNSVHRNNADGFIARVFAVGRVATAAGIIVQFNRVQKVQSVQVHEHVLVVKRRLEFALVYLGQQQLKQKTPAHNTCTLAILNICVITYY